MAGILLNRSRQVPAEETPAFGGIAERFRRAGDLERAIALCRDGLKRFPDQLSARVTLGWSLLDKGQYDEARAELEKVLRKAPDNLAAIRGLAELHDRSEGAMPAMDDRESWRQDEADTTADLNRAAAPAAEPVVTARATPQPGHETAVDPFAPIAVTLGSSTAAEPPKLLHTAEHAGLAAQEAAASSEAREQADQAVLPVQLEDPATASMAAAEVPTPFFASSSERDTAELAIEPAGHDSASGLTVDLDGSSATIDFEMVESSDSDLVFNSGDDATLSLDWDARSAPAVAEPYVGLDAPADVAPSSVDEDELEDAIKALRDDTIVLADLPVADAIVEVESPGEPVVAFDTAVEPEFVLDDALAALQIEDEPASASFDADVALSTTELEPPLFEASDLDAQATFEVQAQELPDAVPVMDEEEERAPVGLIELPPYEGDNETLAVAVEAEEAALPIEAVGVAEEIASGPVFELVAPEPVLFSDEDAVSETDALATEKAAGFDVLTPDLFSLISDDEEVALEAELSSMVEALGAGVVGTPGAEAEPVAERPEPELDVQVPVVDRGPIFEPEPALDAEPVLEVEAATEAELAVEVEPALEPAPGLARVSLPEPPRVEAELAPGPVPAHVDQAVQESVTALFSSPTPPLADVVVNIESRREPKPALVALERLLRKVEVRRLQLLKETVA